MKTIKKYIIAFAALILIGGCELYKMPTIPVPTAGTNVDFSKTVAVGSSLTAGFMNGALYTDGQNNSFMKILAAQFAKVKGGTFNQPDINAVAGDYGITSGLPASTYGRLYLKGTTGSPCPTGGPAPSPKAGNAITPYTGDKTQLNNFSAYKASIQLAQAPAFGGPNPNPYFNPWYARFASNPSVNGTTGSTLITDASAALANNGTFFVFWLGIDDVLGFALNGADQADATAPLTATPTFTAAYNLAITAILNAKTTTKGVVGNIPKVNSLPYFTTVTWNPVVFLSCSPTDVGTVAALNGAGAYGGFNGALQALVPGTITQAEADKRKVTFHTGANSTSGANGAVIKDETLVDLTAALSAINPGLAIFGQVRQTTSADLLCLSAGSVLPTGKGVNPAVGFLDDKYVILPSEGVTIQASIDAFNAVISAAVAASPDRLVLFDANARLAEVVSPGVAISGSVLSSSVKPPFGAFSLDGVHPCARGQAYIANKIIEAINAKWGSTIPLCNPNEFTSNELPVP